MVDEIIDEIPLSKAIIWLVIALNVGYWTISIVLAMHIQLEQPSMFLFGISLIAHTLLWGVWARILTLRFGSKKGARVVVSSIIITIFVAISSFVFIWIYGENGFDNYTVPTFVKILMVCILILGFLIETVLKFVLGIIIWGREMGAIYGQKTFLAILLFVPFFCFLGEILIADLQVVESLEAISRLASGWQLWVMLTVLWRASDDAILWAIVDNANAEHFPDR